ncbi:hypothetical protein CRE_22860 [Caenorhabditis remanei]|uniref:Reverse transcriptase domain-containing protein n=1 Tax=Caenorhabditis remanei TaxID=31234 RepID=E3MHL4_CAERE|nr:hypothetical protein CRE_22860 [Caenorhabditis remanei]
MAFNRPAPKRKQTSSDDDLPLQFVPYSAYKELHNQVVALTSLVNQLRGAIIESGQNKLALEVAESSTFFLFPALTDQSSKIPPVTASIAPVKAFDQVPLNLLLNKLALFDIPPLFISWFSDFLTSRSFSVKVNSTTDPSSALIHSGVPQGSVSGPLLFLLYINDLLISLQSIPYLHFAAYADDIKIYSHLPSSLQAGIDLVSDWAVSNDLPLAHSKTGLLRLGSLNPSHRFHIVGSPILDSHSVRDLGILFEPDLKFSAHIKKSVSLARLRSSQILKSFKSNNPAFYSFLFKTYVLPILEYASVIFCLAPSSSLSRLLESTLRIYSRKTLQRCNIAFSSYSHRLELLSIYSIRHRRLKSQLLLLYKFIAGASHFPNLNSFIRLSSSPRRPMTLIYVSPLSDNFFSFILPIWNAIVANVSSFLSPSQFEHLLDSAITRF